MNRTSSFHIFQTDFVHQRTPTCSLHGTRYKFCGFVLHKLEEITLAFRHPRLPYRSLYDRCQGGLYDRQLQENIGISVTNLQELLNDYEQQWIENDTSSHFTCPVEDGQEDRRGRRRYVVPERSLTCLFQIHGKWEQVARYLGVSYRTLLRRRHEYGLAVSDTRGPRTTYTNISQSDLCNVVRDVLGILPNAGETFVLGALRQRGIHIQRWRVRDAIWHVDPLTRAMRRSVAIIRRAYNVPCPNALW